MNSLRITPEHSRNLARKIVKEVIGRELKGSEQVHHFDGNVFNNKNNNLILCPNKEYHNLLHKRLNAKMACGNVNWRKCVYCKEWDDPNNDDFYTPRFPNSNASYHRTCATIYRREWRCNKGRG